MENFIFKIKLSGLLSLFFLVLGGIFFAAGVDMIFLQKILINTGKEGFVFASWFCLIIGGLVGFTGLQNCISPMTLIMVSNKGVSLKASPGPTRKLTLIPWENIIDIQEGQIIMSGSKGNRVIHRTVKFVLKPESSSVKSRITDAMLRWSNNEVNFDSTYFKVDLNKLIKILKTIKEDPNRFDQLNVDIDYFLKHNNIA